MNRYPLTRQKIEALISKAYPEAQPQEDEVNDVEHTLWMIGEIEQMDKQGKIDRWLGWILAKAHSLGLITLKEARDFVRQDHHQASA